MLQQTRQKTASETPVSDLLQALHENGGGEGEVSVSHVLESLGAASLSAVMLILALVVVTPVSGIPGLSSIFGILIALVAIQRAIGKQRLWLPHWILDRRIDRGKLDNSLAWLDRPAYWADRLTRRRLTALVQKPFSTVMALICVLCGLAMPLLELVPFSSSILASAVSLMAIALVARDGAFALLALLVVGSVSALAIYAM